MKKAFYIQLILALATPCFAQEYPGLNSLIAMAKEKNPEMLAVREKWNAAKAGVIVERTWDNPELFVDYQTMPVDALKPRSWNTKA